MYYVYKKNMHMCTLIEHQRLNQRVDSNALGMNDYFFPEWRPWWIANQSGIQATRLRGNGLEQSYKFTWQKLGIQPKMEDGVVLSSS